MNKFIEKFKDEEFKCVNLYSELGIKINDCLTNVLSHYSLDEIMESVSPDMSSHYVIVLSGGHNGNGDWCEYLKDLHKVMNKLKNEFKECWLIDMQIDCADDVHNVFIGINYV